MLEKIIVVDYAEGAGGEFFSGVLTEHLHGDQTRWLQKYFNSQSLICADWDINFEKYLDEFLLLCNTENVKNIAIPYHLYKWPHHQTLFNRIATTVRFVKINNNGNDHNVALDFLRKIYLQKVTDISDLKFMLTNATATQKLQAIARFKNRALYGLDVKLILDNKAISTLNRRQLIDTTLAKQVTLPTSDIEINYDDFFVNFADIADKYYLLCTMLDLVPDPGKLEALVKRNKLNLEQLNQFITDFPTLYEEL